MGRFRVGASAARTSVFALALVKSLAAAAQENATMHATGTFDVKVAPETGEGKPAAGAFGRMSLEKTFHGGLEATSTGTMLTASAEGWRAYVALEQVTGSLAGRLGTFLFMHNATMQGSDLSLNVTVVPGSATADLTGLTGHMTIRMEGGQHYYDFAYTLPAKQP